MFGKSSRKAIAATLLLVFTISTFGPSAAYALTSGPTQPEATNFEPIDTTDMVNTQTGDFTYNVPLLEIPGPEGGYPLALSYHGGIQTNMDASWVGLGWSLNPGAIARSVNGYPDDWDAIKTSVRTYWNGGQTTTYSVGVSIGIAETPATVGFGLSFAQDTYRGFGVGYNVSIGWAFQEGNHFGLNAGLSAGVNPYGGAYLGASVSVGFGIPSKGGQSLKGSLGISAQTNFRSVVAGFGGGIGYGLATNKAGQTFGGSLLGSTISTDGSKPSLELGGLENSISNSNAGVVKTHSSGISVGIPVWYGVNLQLGYSKVRYWTDETDSAYTYGVMYNSGLATQGRAAPNNLAYDEYALPEAPSYKNIVDYPDPTIVQGGSFPETDEYSVNAQGLAGNMRPYMMQGALFNQNQLNGSTPLVTYYAALPANFLPYYRFENDFSNRYMQQDLGNYTYPQSDLTGGYDMMTVVPPLDGSPVWGSPNDPNPNYGGSPDNNNLAGSRHVDVGPTIHPLDDLGYNKSDRIQVGEIEGFSITNESGVTYHFGLPAYSYNEENYQENLDPQSGSAGNRVARPTPYAYTWYLTTITGPDYVDRNGDGIADDGDWGYWVDFEYGKWGNEYNWRNPSDGYQRDEDNQFQDCSVGTKEVYYLNAIRTRTHIALFEKGIRNDAKGESPAIFQKNVVNGIPENYLYPAAFDINSSQSLKLTHVYLLNIADSAFVTPHSGNPLAYQPTGQRQYPCSDCELAQNILDSTDVAAVGRAALEAKAIRVIDFNYDYSLCPGTENSFNINGPYNLYGKLTLDSVGFRGKGGASSFPDLIFGYDLPASSLKTATGVTMTPTQFTTTASNFVNGDMIMNSNYPYTYYGVVTGSSNAGGVYTYTLANSTYVSGPNLTVNIQTTKNPAYDKDAYDQWGMYKSDINMSLVATNENLYRQTSVTSSAGVDAWSLRTVTSQTGAQTNIVYGPDSYSNVVLPTNYPFVFTGLAPASGPPSTGNNASIQFTLNNSNGYNVSDFFSVGGTGSIVLAPQYPLSACVFTAMTLPFLTQYTITSMVPSGTNMIIYATLANPIPGTISKSSVSSWDGCIVGGPQTWNGTGTGNVSPTNTALTSIYGGGICVNSISTTDDAGVQYITDYNYNIPNAGNVSSGATTYTPSVLDAPAVTTNYLGGTIDDTSDYNNYRRVLYSQLSSLYAIAREMPAPGVIYQYVTVTNMIQNPGEVASPHRMIEGSNLYQYEVPRANMVQLTDLSQRYGPVSSSYGNQNTRNVALMSFTGSIGNMVRSVQYDNLGNKLSETINHYLHDGLVNLSASNFFTQYTTLLGNYNDQGYLQERFSEVKNVQNQTPSSNNGVYAGLFERRTYPCIQTGQTVINYVNGTQTSSTNLAFDFYSGAVTEKVETDAYGNNIMTETIPAYREYTAMGVKSNTDTWKNMLTQTAETYKIKVDGNNNPLELMSAEVNTWTDQMNIFDQNGNSYVENFPNYESADVWRLQSTYDWKPTSFTVSSPDGTTPYSSFVDFDWANPSASNTNWKNTSTITRYDVYSKSLEATDINGIYSATKMDYGDNKVILTGGPANYYEIAFSGAEDAAVNQTANIFVQAGNGTQTNAAAHTGAQSLLLGVSGQKGFVYTIPTSNLTSGRTYQASVWVKPTSGTSSTVVLQYSVNGTVTGTSTMTSGNSTKTANGWSLVNLIIPGSSIAPGNTLSVYAINNDAAVQAYVDDFRFQPINASTTAYVYDPFSGELDYMLDNSNIYVKYTYDGAGRLAGVYKEKLGVGVFLASSFQYNYATYASAAITNQNYTVNDCGTGQQGSVVSVSIPAGTYTSSVSQAAANALAQNAAQTQANEQGYCSVVNALSVTNNANIAIVITNSAGTTVFRGTYSAGSYNLPAIQVGTYSVNVVMTDGVTHNVSITNYSTQTGTNVTFTGVSFASPLTISVY